MPVLTCDLKNLAGVSSTLPVQFSVEAPRSSGDGARLIVNNNQPITVHPVAGVVTSPNLDPGPAVVRIGGRAYPFTIPDVAGSIPFWPLVESAAVNPPTDPTWQSVVSGMISSLQASLDTIYVRSVNGVPVDPTTGDVTVPTGGGGPSLSVTDNGDGTLTLTDSTGTIVTDNGDGTLTLAV